MHKLLFYSLISEKNFKSVKKRVEQNDQYKEISSQKKPLLLIILNVRMIMKNEEGKKWKK